MIFSQRDVHTVLVMLSVNLGCSVDAIHILDDTCSGRRECEYVVPQPALYAVRCTQDYTSDSSLHLQAAYTCIDCKYTFPSLFTCDQIYKQQRTMAFHLVLNFQLSSQVLLMNAPRLVMFQFLHLKATYLLKWQRRLEWDLSTAHF